MKLYFNFKEGTHIGSAFERLRFIFKTAQIEKAESGINEITIDAYDFEKHKDKFPYPLAVKLTQIRSNKPTVLEFLVNGWNEFDNQNCQKIIQQITNA